jgi:hypothetical protein
VSNAEVNDRVVLRALATVLLLAVTAWGAWITDRGMKSITTEEHLIRIEQKLDLLIAAHEIKGK